jgi:hypothetical protein
MLKEGLTLRFSESRIEKNFDLYITEQNPTSTESVMVVYPYTKVQMKIDGSPVITRSVRPSLRYPGSVLVAPMTYARNTPRKSRG